MSGTVSTGSGQRAVLRAARADDAAAIAHVHAAAWQSAYRGILPARVLQGFRFERRLPFWRALLSTEQPPLVQVADVAEAGVLGFVWGRRITEARAAYDAEIIAIAVEPARQRAGLGRRLMGAAAESLADRGATRLYLWVYRDNRQARAFYESLGGRIVDEDVEQFQALTVPTVAFGWDSLGGLATAAGRDPETTR